MAEEREFDPNEVLEELMKNHHVYFTEERYKTPTSRYEAWLMVSCLSNLIVAKTLEKAFEDLKSLISGQNIFQNNPESFIIKGKKEIQNDSGASKLKKRGSK